MTLVNPYCTLEALKWELKFPQADTSKDDELKAAINDASRWIDNRTGRDFFFHDHTTVPLVLDEYDAIFEGALFLPYRPVITITSLSAGAALLTSGTDYRWVAGGDRVYRLGASWLPARVGNLITVYGTFGYPQATTADVPTGLPGYITHAARLVAAAFSGHNRKEIVGLDGNKMEVFTKEIPKLVLDALGAKVPVII